MEKIFIDYGQRINTAILGVIKDILKDLSNSKISSNHCFYISFKTKDSGVNISNNLLKEYPTALSFSSNQLLYSPNNDSSILAKILKEIDLVEANE